MKKLKTVLSLFLVAGLLVGCGGSSDGDKKVATLSSDSDATLFDSTTENNATTIQMINAQSEGLYRLDENSKGELGLAKEVKISDDQMTYTFTLRDTTWSNGDALTANDFVFAFQRLFDLENVPNAINNQFFALKGLLGLKNAEEVIAGTKTKDELGVKAIDEKTLELSLQDPCPIIEQLLAYPCFFPLNEKFVTEAGDKYGTTPELTLGCGPFVLTQWEGGSSLVFEKNEKYYDTSVVKVDKLKFLVQTDATARALSYENGDVQFAKISGELAEKYEGSEGYTTILESYLSYLSFNQKVAGFENENLRRAFSLAIDKETLVNDVLKDGSKAANFIVPEGLADGPDGKDFRESVGSDVKYLTYDKAEALKYYELAKKELGKDKFEYNLMVGETDVNKLIAEYYKEQIENALPGVTIVINQQPSKTFYAKADAKDFEILSIMWGPDYAYPTTYTDLWKTGGANNYSQYSSAAYDKLQEATTTGALLSDPVARWDALKEMEKILLEDDAAISPQFQRGWVGLINPKLKGIIYRSSGVKFDYREISLED